MTKVCLWLSSGVSVQRLQTNIMRDLFLLPVLWKWARARTHTHEQKHVGYIVCLQTGRVFRDMLSRTRADNLTRWHRGTKIWWQMTISRKQQDSQRRSHRYCIVLTVPVVQSSVSPTVNNLRDPQQSYKHGVHPALACPRQKGTNGLSAIPQAYLRKFSWLSVKGGGKRVRNTEEGRRLWGKVKKWNECDWWSFVLLSNSYWQRVRK